MRSSTTDESDSTAIDRERRSTFGEVWGRSSLFGIHVEKDNPYLEIFVVIDDTTMISLIRDIRLIHQKPTLLSARIDHHGRECWYVANTQYSVIWTKIA